MTSNSFRAPANLPGVRKLRQWLRDTLSRHRLPESTVHQLLSAISELSINAISHPRPPAQVLELECRIEAGTLTVELSCDSSSFADRDALLAAVRPVNGDQLFEESGRGLHIVMSMFPDLEYVPRAVAEDGLERFRLRRAWRGSPARDHAVSG